MRKLWGDVGPNSNWSLQGFQGLDESPAACLNEERGSSVIFDQKDFRRIHWDWTAEEVLLREIPERTLAYVSRGSIEQPFNLTVNPLAFWVQRWQTQGIV